MGFLHWVFGKHPVPPARPPDPGKVVEAAVLPLWVTPMIIGALEQDGIRATFAEVTPMHLKAMINPTQSAIVYVMEPDKARAKRTIDELMGADDEADDEAGDEAGEALDQ